MILRPETPSDHPAVARVVEAAFANPAHARLVAALRAEPSAWALVAVDGAVVVGHAMVTDSLVAAEDGSAGRVATLSPLSVTPARHGEGIGSALVAAVTRRCRDLGEPALALEGSPRYYGRFGFGPALAHGLVLPLPVWAPPEAAQVLVLGGPVPSGVATYAPPFDEFG